jgi:hypothetical protein
VPLQSSSSEYRVYREKCVLEHLPSIMTSYASEYPPVPFDAAYKKFFEDFYATSDAPDAHSKYVEQFTPDATLIMASKKAKGSEGPFPCPRSFRPCPSHKFN